LEIYPPVRRDQTAANWHTKAELYKQLKFTLTTPSRWLLNCARESMLAPAIERTAVVPYGIDLDFFRPAPVKSTAREALGIAPEERAICFVADNGRATPWRDFGFVEKLVDAYRQEYPERRLVVLEVGSTEGKKTLGNVRLISTGRLPAEGVRRVFQASDLMVYPAKADNLPYVILEALACGTPVLATRVGGLPEEFVDGESGFLFEPGDLAHARRCLAELLADAEKREKMSAAARLHAENNYTMDRMVSAYEQIYAASA
jgi:glycosyltransferase involved in cell wall biosynthesis